MAAEFRLPRHLALDEIPPTLEIQAFNRVVRHAQFHRVFARAVDSNSEMGYARRRKHAHRLPGKLDSDIFRHEIRWHGAGVLAEFVAYPFETG